MTSVNGTTGTLPVKLKSGKVLRYTYQEIHEMIMSLHSGDEMYHMADNIPKWLMVSLMKAVGESNFTPPIIAATIATLEAMLMRKQMLVFTEDGFNLISAAEYENRQHMLEGIYNVLSGADFEEFMAEDGDFMRHIEGEGGCLDKDDILLEIERLFKRIL